MGLDTSFALFSTVTASFMRQVSEGVQRLADTTSLLEQYKPATLARPNLAENEA